jgi:hypothetical protein
LMAKLGISNNTRVVAYDERGGIYATPRTIGFPYAVPTRRSHRSFAGFSHEAHRVPNPVNPVNPVKESP